MMRLLPRRRSLLAGKLVVVEMLESRLLLTAASPATAQITADISPAVAVSTTITAGTTAANSMSNINNVLGVDITAYDAYGTTSQTYSMVEAAGLNVFRYIDSDPDVSHFNVDPGTSWGAESPAQFGQFITTYNATGIINVNYGSGSPQEAEAELAYMDGKTTDTTVIGNGTEWNYVGGQWQSQTFYGHTVGYWASIRAATPLGTDDGMNFLRIGRSLPFTGITDWEIGNEEYGSWETDNHAAEHDPSTYASFCASFASFVKADQSNLPTILTGIDSGSPLSGDWSGWTQHVLTDCHNLGFTPGFISDHIYPQSPGAESDSYLLNDTVTDPSTIESGDGPLDWTTRYNDYESLLVSTLGSSAAQTVKVLATEFNSCVSTGTNPGSPGNDDYPGKQSTSLVAGLFVADSLGSMMESGYGAACFWDLRNAYDTTQNNSSSLYGWRTGGDLGMLGDPNNDDPPTTAPYVAYPTYYAEQLVSKIAQSGGQVVSASGNNSSVSVYAVKEANGHLDLLVINKNSSASVTDQFNISSFQTNGKAQQFWQYGETQDTAQSQSGTGASSLGNFTAALSLSGSNFSYTFPAYSMTVIDLTPSAATTTAVTSSNGSPSYGQSVTFTATVTPASGSGETGNVQFQIDGGNVGSAIMLSGNTATYATSTLSTGSHTIVAVYSGDGNFTASTSPTFTQSVGLPAWLSSTSAATWNAGTTTLTVTGNATIVADPNASGVVPIINAGNGTHVVLSTSVAHISSLTLQGNATLDISSDTLFITYGNGSSPLAAVQTAVKNAAIFSSTANAGNPGQYTVGFADSTELSLIAAGNVEVMYSLAGDANLDGTVNFNDFSILQNNYDQTGRDWAQGDFNHDGVVNFNDFSILQNNYDQTAAGSISGAAANIAADTVYRVYSPEATTQLFTANLIETDTDAATYGWM